ncbi:MAG: reductase DrgA [Planctomycetaceae bacterium]|nr:reductase DrgA [Planctomycetaceae bacterium]
MDTFEAICQRRSVKQFDPSHEMTDAEIRKLLDAAIQSPTSFNCQHWRFVVVKDAAMRAEIQAASFNQTHVTEASLLVVLAADLKAWAKEPQRYWKHAPPEILQRMVSMIGPFHEGNDQLQRDEAMRSCGLAGQTIMLAAKAMGYDSCPMIGFDPVKVGALIHLPADHVIGFMVVVGKAVQPARQKPGQLALDDVVVQDRFD